MYKKEKVKNCSYCRGDREGYTVCFKTEEGKQPMGVYIPEGKALIVIPRRYNGEARFPISYCPFCGRPLTEEACVELERRIGGNDG